MKLNAKRRPTHFYCVKCGKYNETTYPTKTDKTPSELGVTLGDGSLLDWVSYQIKCIGFRKCKHCNTWHVIVMCGWYNNRDTFAYYPLKIAQKQGSVGIEVAQWVIKQSLKLKITVPKPLQDVAPQ